MKTVIISALTILGSASIATAQIDANSQNNGARKTAAKMRGAERRNRRYMSARRRARGTAVTNEDHPLWDSNSNDLMENAMDLSEDKAVIQTAAVQEMPSNDISTMSSNDLEKYALLPEDVETISTEPTSITASSEDTNMALFSRPTTSAEGNEEELIGETSAESSVSTLSNDVGNIFDPEEEDGLQQLNQKLENNSARIRATVAAGCMVIGTLFMSW